MRNFDLELYKNGFGIQTRNGHDAKIVSYDEDKNKLYPIEAQYYDNDNELCTGRYSIEGKVYSFQEDENDLVMKPVEKWQNIEFDEKKGRLSTSGILYSTEEKALECKSSKCIATIKIII